MTEINVRATKLFQVVLGLFLLLAILPAHAGDDKKVRGVSSQIKIMATPPVIYESIRAMGKETGNVKVLESAEDHALLEESFKGLPIIGDAVCVYEERYAPHQRIDYHLVRSDKFKAFEGGWELVPNNDGSTSVTLRHYTDTGLRIPFIRQITDSATMKDIEKRLSDLKQQSEAKHNHQAAQHKS
jgi:hypothetical protein